MRPLILLTMSALLLSGCSDSESDETADTSQSQNTATPSQTPDSSDSEPVGFESPEAAFQAMKAAAQRDDFPAAVRCLTPESQGVMAMMMTFPLAMMAAFDPDMEKEVEALMQRHGISMDDESEDFPIDQIPDRIAFITDVVEFMEANSDGEDDEGPIKQMADAELHDLTIDGNEAHGTVRTSDGESEAMDFVQIDGRWLIQLPMEMGGDMSGDMDFSGDFEGFGGGMEPEAPIEAISMDAFNSAWQVSVQETDTAAEPLLTRLADELGLELDATGAGDALQQTVTVDKTGVSRHEVIEDICRQIAVTPEYGSSSLTLRPGVREIPAAFSGPFTALAKELSTDPETATGQLTLQVVAHGIPSAILQQMDAGFDEPLVVQGAFDANGESLENPMKTGLSYSGNPTTSFDREVIIGLRNLLKNVESISSVEVSIAFSVPTAVETLTFDDLTAGKTQTAGTVEIVLSQVEGTSFTFEYTTEEDETVQIIGYDADGMPLDPFGTSSFGGGGSSTVAYDYETAPQRFEARIVTASEAMNFDLAMENVRLPDHEQMPEKLTELSFTGDTPMILEFVRITGDEGFREVVFKATNQSNKHVESVSMMMSYQDADGMELENQSMQWEGDVIASGESAEIEVAAYFMPEETKKVVGTTDGATFTDATTWETNQ